MNMSSKAVHDEILSEVPNSQVPNWLVPSFIVMGVSAGYTLVAYSLWLWAS